MSSRLFKQLPIEFSMALDSVIEEIQMSAEVPVEFCRSSCHGLDFKYKSHLAVVILVQTATNHECRVMKH